MPTARIQQLSPALVNRIAAGEVIERPASVVKELVENALDAGAEQIIVEVGDGGRELIRVSDDGRGIDSADMPLAFASHATSKLTSDDDLFRIATMGFRGEALASIGAVSHARITSRTAQSEAAYEVANRGGSIGDPQAAAANVGTSVEVRNLFFNTPARRKFLKGASTEFGHISDMVQRLAIPYPNVAFKLIHNGRTSLDWAACEAVERWLAAWPGDFRQSYLPIQVRDAEITLVGVVGLPELARPTARHQFLYLNGRYIRDKSLQHALREAYRGLTEPGRHPAGILMLSIPPADVDVNVHPTKIEVRFRDSGRMHSLVLSAVREQLLGSDLTPRAVARPAFSGAGAVAAAAATAPRQEMREQLAAFFKRGPAGSGFSVQDSESEIPKFQLSNPSPQSQTLNPHPSTLTPSPAIQLHNSYLVAQSEDGLVIIDQHALHERIMYEELLAKVSRGPLESQRLLIPQTFSASAKQLALLEQIAPLLGRLGIEAAPFGPDSVAVQAFPSFLEKLEPATFVQELLERGEQEQLDLHEEEMLHDVLDMMACKAAVKAGDPLTPGEIEALLARRELVERSSNCPHGRPTTLRLSLHDLEKQFKRTGF
jgi:DNA mismatch repair protein MutL